MSKLSDLHEYGPLGGISNAKFDALRKSLSTESPKETIDDPSSVVGIEVEIENCPQGDIRMAGIQHFWNVEPDGSLRDHGIEFVSVPMKGSQVPFALKVLAEGLPKGTRFSLRTSVHVHINMRSLSPTQVANIALVYLTVEKSLFRFAGDYREKNIFCVPLGSLDMLDRLYHNIMALDKGGMKRIQTQDLRYSALNFEPMFSLGTIEFRHLGGTLDLERLCLWVNTLLTIKRFAEGISQEDLVKQITDLNTNSNYRAWAERVLGTPMVMNIGYNDLYKDIELGVMLVKQTILSDNYLTKLRMDDWGNSIACKRCTTFFGGKKSAKPRSALEILADNIQAEARVRPHVDWDAIAQQVAPPPAEVNPWMLEGGLQPFRRNP